MRKFILIAAVVVAAGGRIYDARSLSAAQAAATPQAQTAPTTVTDESAAATATDGLSDLEAMTFSCPTAGLNAAAREARKVPSQGTYQFSYFRIVNDAHHASYEVHFKSNYEGEPELKYCVALYCQQGWDPKTTKATVTPMAAAPPRGTGSAHAAMCSAEPAPARRRPKG